MKQHSVHTEMIKQIAERLGPLRPKVVFLGGSASNNPGENQKNCWAWQQLRKPTTRRNYEKTGLKN